MSRDKQNLLHYNYLELTLQFQRSRPMKMKTQIQQDQMTKIKEIYGKPAKQKGQF